MKTFTLICHKPTSSSYSSGHHMATYYSDYAIHTDLSAQEVIDIIANHESIELDYDEDGYNYCLIYCEDNKLVTIENFQSGPPYADNDIKDIYNSYKEKAKLIAHQRTEETLKEKRKEEKRKKKYEEDIEREEYEKLKKKFGEG